MIESGAGYLATAVTATLAQLIMLAPGLALALVLYYVAGALKGYATRLWGLAFIYFTAIGVAVHELGHALFAVLFAHEVTSVNLFGPDLAAGTAGYVRHRWDRRSLYQNMGNFFIGIGPIILGSIIIYLAARFLMGGRLLEPLGRFPLDANSLATVSGLEALGRELINNAMSLLSAITRLDNFRLWQFYAFLYLALAVGSNMHLSPSDLAGAGSGFVAFVLALLLFNLIAAAISGFAARSVAFIGSALGALYGFMVLAIVLTAAFLALLFVLSLLGSADCRYA